MPRALTVIASTLALFAVGSGARAQPQMVTDLRPGPQGARVDNFTRLGPWLVFDGDNGAVGGESWRSDGTAAGTTLIEDYTPGPMFWSHPRYALLPDGRAFVTVTTYANGDIGQSLGNELWVSDLTPGGTSIYFDLYPGQFGSWASGFVRVGPWLLFSAQRPTTGAGVFRSDGGPGGVQLVRDFDPGNLTGRTAGPIAALNGGALILSTGPEGSKLWWSDATDPGTQLVADFGAINSQSTLSGVIRWGDVFISQFEDGVHSRNSMYSTTGAIGAGATFVREFSANDYSNTWMAPSPVESSPRLFYAVSEFNEDWEFQGHNVFALDIAGAEPVLLATIQPSDGIQSLGFQAMTATAGGSQGKGRVYWMYEPTDGHTEVWTSDGTAMGTRVVALVAEASPFFHVLGEHLLFVADDEVNGAEMWVSDGTVAGTRRITDIGPGASHGCGLFEHNFEYPEFAVVGDRLFFNANDGVHGFELWSWRHPLLADCNGNSIPDHQDLLQGTLNDSNHDAVPDTCQCLADWDGSGTSDVPDIFTFLSSWFGGDADVNNDGSTNVPDIFGFLAVWFAGC